MTHPPATMTTEAHPKIHGAWDILELPEMSITTNRTVDADHDGAVANATDPKPEVPERGRGSRRLPVVSVAPPTS